MENQPATYQHLLWLNKQNTCLSCKCINTNFYTNDRGVCVGISLLFSISVNHLFSIITFPIEIMTYLTQNPSRENSAAKKNSFTFRLGILKGNWCNSVRHARASKLISSRWNVSLLFAGSDWLEGDWPRDSFLTSSVFVRGFEYWL